MLLHARCFPGTPNLSYNMVPQVFVTSKFNFFEGVLRLQPIEIVDVEFVT